MCKACWKAVYGLANWDIDYVNNLSDASFAVIEPDYINGKTNNKNARHLPHHDLGVKTPWDSNDHVNKSHLAVMLENVKEIEPVTSSMTKEMLVSRASKHLKNHMNDLNLDSKTIESNSGKLKSSDDTFSLSAELAESLANQGIKLQSDGSIGAELECGIVSVDHSKTDIEGLEVRLQAAEKGGLSARDLRPKPEDFVYSTYRAISKVITPGRFLNFTIGNVLKNSAKLLNKQQTVYPNHQHYVEDWLGVIPRAWWDETKTPPGINVEVMIDAIKAPEIARGMLMEPPAVKKASVQISLDWEKSHDLPADEFFNMLGKKVDDKLVTIDVIKIKNYGEFSLVWKGEVPDAGKLPGKVKIGSDN